MTQYEATPWTPIHRLHRDAKVFHYTSAPGLLGMLQTGTAWATEASGLNDVEEIVAGRRYVAERLAQLPNEELTGDLKFAHSQVYDANGPRASDVFVLSASLQEDDANQWRLYGDFGRGFCVEFDCSMDLVVRARTKLAPTTIVGEGPRLNFGLMRDVAYVSPWTRVLYGEEERASAFDDLIRWAELSRSLAAQAEWAGPESGDPSPDQVVSYEMSRALASLSRCVKGRGFSGESEARIHASFLWGDHHAHFRSGATGIVRHFELMPPKSTPVGEVQLERRKSPKRLPIRSIRLGPSQRPELSVPAIKSLLWRCGYKDSVEVIASSVTLR